MYGVVVDTGDGQGVLDLRDWTACSGCSEPVLYSLLDLSRTFVLHSRSQTHT
jgi:hypothetical protein